MKNLQEGVDFAGMENALSARGQAARDALLNSAKTGEPIIRHMEYAFPHQGFVDCKDQFMLGDRYLVAPVLTTTII